MKQHITTDQLLELSDKGKEKLNKWWNQKPYSKEYCIQCENEGLQKPYLLPLLSIGQMIEYLDDYLTTNDEDDVDIISKRGYGTWQIDFFHSMRDKSYQSKELCDALWKAVKEVLEK